jgi:hypothetical protein
MSYLNIYETLKTLSETFEHLNKFLKTLEVLGKINILKNNMYDFMIPTSHEVDLFENITEKGKTINAEGVNLLCRFIKKKNSFKNLLKNNYQFQKLDNDSTIYYRYIKKDKTNSIPKEENITSQLILGERSLGINESLEKIYEEIKQINDKVLKKYIKTTTHQKELLKIPDIYFVDIDGKEILFLDYLKNYNKNIIVDSDEEDSESESISRELLGSDIADFDYRNSNFNYIIKNYNKNTKKNNIILEKISKIMLKKIKISNLIKSNSNLKNTIEKLFNYQLNPLVLITIILQPFSVVNDDSYLFNYKKIKELNFNNYLLEKKFVKEETTTIKVDDDSLASLKNNSCIKIIKKFMKNNSEYNKSSLEKLFNHYYSIMDSKENAYKILWLLFNIYYLESIYVTCNNIDNYLTYIRLFSVKPMNKDKKDMYFESLKRIVKLFEDRKSNEENSLPGLINFCLWVSLEEDNSFLFFDQSDLDVEDHFDTTERVENEYAF